MHRRLRAVRGLCRQLREIQRQLEQQLSNTALTQKGKTQHQQEQQLSNSAVTQFILPIITNFLKDPVYINIQVVASLFLRVRTSQTVVYITAPNFQNNIFWPPLSWNGHNADQHPKTKHKSACSPSLWTQLARSAVSYHGRSTTICWSSTCMLCPRALKLTNWLSSKRTHDK